jgi:PAS domain S-box-containing protein
MVRVYHANPAAGRILGQTQEEILGEGWQGPIEASDPPPAGRVAERQRTGRAHGQLRARRKNGSPFPIEISSVVFQNPLGNPERA